LIVGGGWEIPPIIGRPASTQLSNLGQGLDILFFESDQNKVSNARRNRVKSTDYKDIHIASPMTSRPTFLPQITTISNKLYLKQLDLLGLIEEDNRRA